jgi:hypothetical protein
LPVAVRFETVTPAKVGDRVARSFSDCNALGLGGSIGDG